MSKFTKNRQYYKFCLYGFFKNLKFFEPFLMLFFMNKGITFFQIGVLYAVREISINILEIPTGIIADVLGRKKTMMASFMSYILSFAVFYTSNSYSLLLVAMLFFSLGDALRTGTHKAMIFDYLIFKGWQSQKVNYYGHTRSWSQFGSAISSLLAALIVVISGNYEFVFVASSLPYLLNLLLISTYPSQLDGPIRMSEHLSLKQGFKEMIAFSKQSAKSFQLWRVILNMAIFQGYFKAIKDYLQPIILMAAGSIILIGDIQIQNKSTYILGLVYFFIFMISSLASRKSEWFVLKFKSIENVLNIMLILGILLGVISGLFISKSISILAVFFFILIYAIQNIRKPVGSSLVAEKVQNSVLATALSVQSLFDSLFASVIALIMGFLADYFSLGTALFIIGLSILLASPFLVLKLNHFSNK